jgi:hypothetical protein
MCRKISVCKPEFGISDRDRLFRLRMSRIACRNVARRLRVRRPFAKGYPRHLRTIFPRHPREPTPPLRGTKQSRSSGYAPVLPCRFAPRNDERMGWNFPSFFSRLREKTTFIRRRGESFALSEIFFLNLYRSIEIIIFKEFGKQKKYYMYLCSL